MLLPWFGERRRPCSADGLTRRPRSGVQTPSTLSLARSNGARRTCFSTFFAATLVTLCGASAVRHGTMRIGARSTGVPSHASLNGRPFARRVCLFYSLRTYMARGLDRVGALCCGGKRTAAHLQRLLFRSSRRHQQQPCCRQLCAASSGGSDAARCRHRPSTLTSRRFEAKPPAPPSFM